jgi:hypothetical protein
MGVLNTNRSQIVAGGLISASFVKDLYDVFTGNITESVSISGSLIITGSITGSLHGTATTASYVLNAVSSSYSSTSSYVANAVSSSYALTSSFLTGSIAQTVTGSFSYVTVSSTFITQGTVFMYTASLPTTNPGVVNQLWRSGSYLMISTGSGS